MSKISCYDFNNNPISSFYQWDCDRSIVVKGVDRSANVPVFHFSNCVCSDALVVAPDIYNEDLSVRVPNILLTESSPIIMYIYEQKESDGMRTVHAVHIPVIPRSKPDDYKYVETVKYKSAAVLDARLTELIKSVTDESSHEIEIVDARIGSDGTVYNTVGEAVRTVDKKVLEVYPLIFSEKEVTPTEDGFYKKGRYWQFADNVTAHSWRQQGDRITFDKMYPITETIRIVFHSDTTKAAILSWKDTDTGWIKSYGDSQNFLSDLDVTLDPSISNKFVLNFRNNSETAITSDDEAAVKTGFHIYSFSSSNAPLLDDVNERIDAIENITGTTSAIGIDAGSEAAKKIAAISNENTVNIAMISDSHFSNAPLLDCISASNTVNNEGCLDFLIHCGDILENTDATSKDAAIEQINKFHDIMKSNRIKSFVTPGNHDFNTMKVSDFSTAISTSEAIWRISDRYNNNLSNSNHGYGYVDFDRAKLRIVILNSSDVPVDSDGNYRTVTYQGKEGFLGAQYSFVIGEEQMRWFANEAVMVPDGWTIAFFSHAIFSDKICSPDKFGVESTYAGIRNGSVLTDILEHRRNKDRYVNITDSSFQMQAKAKDGSTIFPSIIMNYNIDVDYSKCGNVTYAGHFCGHVHKDLDYEDSVMHYSSVDNCCINGGSGDVKVPGTIEETAMDIISIDTVNGTVKQTRIGLGNDREYTFTPVVAAGNTITYGSLLARVEALESKLAKLTNK